MDILRQRVPFFFQHCSGYYDIVNGTSPLSLPKAKANGLKSVKLFGGTEQRNLPSGYTQTAYTYFNTSAYLTTDFVPTYDCKVEFEFKTGSSIVSNATTYLGARNIASGNGGLRVAHITSGVWRIYGFGSYADSTDLALPDTKYKFVYDNGHAVLTTGDTVVFDYTFTNTGGNIYPVTINGWNSAGTVTPGAEPCYVYKLKCWDNQGNLSLDYVPATYNTSVGFYDNADNSFETVTVGTLEAGPSAVPTPDSPMNIVSNNGVLKAKHQSGLPLGYKLVDYIKATAIIELDKPTNDTMELVAKFYREGSNAQYVYQSDTTSSGTTNTTSYISASGNWRFGRRTASINVDTEIMVTSVQNADGVWINGEQVGTYENMMAFTSTNNLKLFGTQSSPTLRLYWLKVYQNGAPVYDLVPCQRESDSAYGVYDLVSGQFFTNPEATITIGSFVSDPVVAKGAGPIETVADTGYYGNLIDLNALTSGYYYNSSGVYTTANNVYLTDWIRVYNGDTITVYFKKTPDANAPVVRMNIFDAQKNWVSQSTMTLNNQDEDVTVLNITADGYIRISAAPTLLDFDTAQIIRGSYTVSTMPDYKAYVPYHTAICEDLLKMGDYQDVQSVLDGEVTRKVGVKVLDGTETWARIDASSGVPFATFNLTLSTTAAGGLSNVPRCSHFRSATSTGRSNIPDNGVGVTANSTYTTMWFRCDSITTKDDFTAWLAQQYNAGTPVIVIYSLATPTTETVTPQTLQVQAGDNTIGIAQAGMDSLTLEAEYKRGK